MLILPEPWGSIRRRREFVAVLAARRPARAARHARAQQANPPTIGFLGPATASAMSAWSAAFVQRAARTRLDRGSHRRDRVSLGRRTQRALRRNRGRVRPAQSRCHCHGGHPASRHKAGDLGHSDCLCGGVDPSGRPGRKSWRDRAATSPACRREPIWLASGWKLCATSSLVSAGWRSWPMLAIPNHRAGDGRSPGDGANARYDVATRNPASRGYRACFEALKGPADALYVCSRPAHEHQPGSHQHLSLGSSTADVVREPGVRRSRSLLSYGPNFPDLFRRAADFVDKILRGAQSRPTCRSSSQPNLIWSQLVTAKLLGLKIAEPAASCRPG